MASLSPSLLPDKHSYYLNRPVDIGVKRSKSSISPTVDESIIVVHVLPSCPEFIHPVITKDLRGVIRMVPWKGSDKVKVLQICPGRHICQTVGFPLVQKRFEIHGRTFLICKVPRMAIRHGNLHRFLAELLPQGTKVGFPSVRADPLLPSPPVLGEVRSDDHREVGFEKVVEELLVGKRRRMVSDLMDGVVVACRVKHGESSGGTVCAKKKRSSLVRTEQCHLGSVVKAKQI